MLLVKKPAAITGCAGSGLAGGGGVGDGADRHLQVWFRGGSVSTLHSTPFMPLHVNMPRQPTAAHIVSSWRHPNVFPSTQGLFESCFVQEQVGGGGDPAAAPSRRVAAARTETSTIRRPALHLERRSGEHAGTKTSTTQLPQVHACLLRALQ